MKRKHPSKAISLALSRPGLTINLAASDAVWSIQSDSAVRAVRFSIFQRNLPLLWSEVDAPVRLALCLIAYDAITNWADLVEATKAATNVQVRGRVALERWQKENTRNSRQEGRSLSARTFLCIRDLPNSVDWLNELQTFKEFLLTNYPKIGSNTNDLKIEEVFLDSSAWHYLNLSPCLFTHIEGALDMPVLPDCVWARLNSPRPLDNEQTLADEVDCISESAMNRMFDLPSSTQTGVPRATLDLLKSIFSVGKNDQGIRLADYLERSETRAKFSLASKAISTDGWIAGFLASWCSHLLNYGSIRRENPSMATLSAYTGELLEPLAAELVQIDKTPAQMLQYDWEVLFDRLSQQIFTAAGIAALRSLHLWAVHTLGCDPMPSVIFRKDDALSTVQSNIVWPNEQRRAIELASTCSLDERIREQTLVMLALGCTGLFRIGDIPSIRIDDIKETAKGISVEIDPSHGSHGGKSRAARRIVFLTDHDITQVILGFQARRARESKKIHNEAIYLFGDPNDKGRLYRFGECARLVNRLLKEATGDSTVSFHTLRHTCASYRSLAMLIEPAAEHAIAPLNLLLHQMAHAGPKTLWGVYFHFSDLAIRAQIDRSETVHRVTSHEAAFWLKTTPESLRQKRHRAQDPSDSFYFDLINREAFGQVGAEQPPWVPYHLSAPEKLHDTADAEITFEWTYKALRALSEESDVDVLASRLSCTHEHIRQLCLATNSALEQLDLGRNQSTAPPLRQTSAPEFCASTIHNLMAAQNWSFSIVKSSPLGSVFRHLTSKGRSVQASSAAGAWRRMYCKQSLSLENRVDPQPFLYLLGAAGFPTQALLVRTQAPSTHKSSIDLENFLFNERNVLMPLFLGTMCAEVRIESTRPRRGHPSRYLLIRDSLTPPKASMPGAAFRMRNVHGIFFALLVFHHLLHELRP